MVDVDLLEFIKSRLTTMKAHTEAIHSEAELHITQPGNSIISMYAEGMLRHQDVLLTLLEKVTNHHLFNHARFAITVKEEVNEVDQTKVGGSDLPDNDVG